MTKRQEKLAKKHGTPEEFRDNIWEACNDLFITTEEAHAAINKYNDEWEEAGKNR